MANLPEKNITTVDKITSIPSNTNLYINANGEFRQATVDDVLKASPVIADSITNQYKNASGSPILLTDSAKGVAIDFNAKGRSTQDGEPTPTEPITPKSVGDMGYFDGELLQGQYDSANGIHANNWMYVCNKNPIPCNAGDTIKLIYGSTARIINFVFFDENGVFLSSPSATNTTVGSVTAPTNASYFVFNVSESATIAIAPSTAKHICVTINGKYALIEKSVGKNNYKIDIVYSSATQNGISLTTDVEKGTATVNGTSTADFGNYLSIESSNRIVKKGSYVLSSNVVGSSTTYGLGFGYKPIGGGGTNYKWVYDTEVTVEFTTDVIVFPLIQVKSGVTVNNLTFYPMIRPLGTDDTYEPYTESVKYIPISSPLRGLGEVSDVASLSEGKVDRKIGYERITTVFKHNADVDNYCYYYRFGNIGSMGNALSNRLLCKSTTIITANGTDNIGIYETLSYGGVVYLNVGKYLTENTVEGMETWLAENPTYIQYVLAEPTTESIEPIDVDTFEGVTQISVSDDADMEVEYPTSKVAGIASIGWSKGRRAEYDLEQLKVQMLALQTTIVSTV